MPASSRIPKHFTHSLARGLSILETFSGERSRLTLQALSNSTGINKVTVQRLTDTLITLGYIGRNQRKEFYLQPRVLTLGFTYLKGHELRHLADTRLDDFARRIGRTVNMAILDNTEVVFIYRHEVNRFYSFGVHEGYRLPSYCTSSGKILLAALDNDELRTRISKMNLEKLTAYTITDPQDLIDEIVQTRARGYSTCDRESSLALYSVAVPIINHTGKTLAAVNISLVAEEAKGDLLEWAINQLMAEGRQLSIILGYDGPYPKQETTSLLNEKAH